MVFQPGVSGNPAGRTKGSRAKRNREGALLASTYGHELTAETISRIVEAARDGHAWALKLLADRLWPARRGRLVNLLGMPRVRDVSEMPRAVNWILGQVATAQLSAEEGEALAGIFKGLAAAHTANALTKRIEDLELAAGGRLRRLTHDLEGEADGGL